MSISLTAEINAFKSNRISTRVIVAIVRGSSGNNGLASSEIKSSCPVVSHWPCVGWD